VKKRERKKQSPRYGKPLGCRPVQSSFWKTGLEATLFLSPVSSLP